MNNWQQNLPGPEKDLNPRAPSSTSEALRSAGQPSRQERAGQREDVIGKQFVWEFITPKGWKVIGRWGDGFQLLEIGGGLRVLIDCEFKDDGKPWLHVSYSRKNWNPNHEDTVKVKQAFIGERYAYAVFPPSNRYVNIHAHCLHLWACMSGDGQVLPEFSAEVENVGRSI